MDHESFDRITRLLGTARTRRAALGTLLGAGLAGAALPRVEAKQKRRAKRRRANRRAKAEAASNSCARLCPLLPPRLRPRCLAEAQANRALCECPSFCRRLYPFQPVRQVECLRQAIETPAASLCVACAADPDRACPQPGGGFTCCAVDQPCQPSGVCGCPATCPPIVPTCCGPDLPAIPRICDGGRCCIASGEITARIPWSVDPALCCSGTGTYREDTIEGPHVRCD